MIRVEVARGTTVEIPIRMESGVLVYRPIAGVEASTPLRLNVPAHGLLDDWRCAVAGAVGLDEGNALSQPPRDIEMRHVTVIDADVIEFNRVDAADWTPYCHGGHVVAWEPLDLSVYTQAEMQVRDKPNGTLLGTYALYIDPALGALWLQLTPVVSEAIAYSEGVFTIRATRATGQVDALCSWEPKIVVTN